MTGFILDIARNAFRLGKTKIILVFFLIFLSTGLELFGISLIIPLISIFVDPSNLDKYKNLVNLNFLDNFNVFNLILILFFLVFLLKYILTIIIEYLVVKYSKRWEIDLILRLINYHLKRPWIESLKNHQPLIKSIETDIPLFINQGITGVLTILKSFLILSGIFIYLFFLKGIITIIIFSIFYFVFFFFLKAFKNYLSRASINADDYIGIKFNLINEISSGFREIKIQNLKKYFLREFFKNENKIAKIDIIRKLGTILPKIIIELICIIGFLLVIFFNSGESKNLISFLGLLTFIVYRSQPLLSSMGALLASLQLYSSQIKKGMKIIDETEKIQNIDENIDKKEIHTDNNSMIEINNLDFSYENNENGKKIFSNLNLSLKFGNIYGLVGKNGTGKSTFADLIIGLLEPQRGEILLNHQNIKSFLSHWINSVSYLSQSYFLFDDTIKNNITLEAKRGETFYKERYEKALKVSNLIEVLDTFIDKDNSFLRDSGKNLSGGQKQRIAIARLIYKNSKVIILDEPTASLDKSSSDLMIKMLQEIKKDKLIIMISHSSEILNQCDKILNIKNNTIEHQK